jgi:hypothetical protein
MKERVRRVVKQGTWLYDGTLPCLVQVIKTNYIEHPSPDDEDQDAGYPPLDPDGNFYYVEYVMEGRVRSVSNCFGSSDEAVQATIKTLKGPIQWLPEGGLHEAKS